MGLLDQAVSFGQGASNSVASMVTGPVDGLAWLLRKAGAPVPPEPLLGSEWMKSRGLMQEPKNRVAGLLGEGIGGALPGLLTYGAPRIASGLLQAADNARRPSELNRQAGVILYHGSNAPSSISRIHDGGVFGGIFASPSRQAAESHGSQVYRMTVPDEAVMRNASDVDWQAAVSTAQKSLPKGTPLDLVEELADMALYNKSAWNSSIDEDMLMRTLRSTDLGEADWALQALRGSIAKNAGYKAALMPDEHGASYLVFPGTAVRPYNDAAKQLYRK